MFQPKEEKKLACLKHVPKVTTRFLMPPPIKKPNLKIIIKKYIYLKFIHKLMTCLIRIRKKFNKIYEENEEPKHV